MKHKFFLKYLTLFLFITVSSTLLNPLHASTKNWEELTADISFKKSVTSLDLPQINIDEFDETTMDHILKNYGSFEVIGPSIEELSEYAVKALQESKEVLNLPLESLENVYHEFYNGFQNVYRETFEAFQLNKRRPVRNQIAFHIKPYLEARIPEGIENLKACENYYAKATSLLYRLYEKIADSFINSDQRTIFNEDAQTSCLTLRKYSPGNEGEAGITPHTDFGLLTLVVSDSDGLEILEHKNSSEWRWLNASSGSSKSPRFYINVGDWLFLQANNEKLCHGVHRVPNVEKDRYSLILFLNPPGLIKLDTDLITLKGIKINYQEFKKAYQESFNRNLSTCSQQLLQL